MGGWRIAGFSIAHAQRLATLHGLAFRLLYGCPLYAWGCGRNCAQGPGRCLALDRDPESGPFQSASRLLNKASGFHAVAQITLRWGRCVVF